MRPLAISILALALALIGAVNSAALAAPVPAPALKVLGVAAPTHLPPRQSEVQRVVVEAEAGTFTLGLEGATTAPIGLGAGAEAVEAALTEVLGADAVSVLGGPGDDANPYFVKFGGAFADRDVAELTADSHELTGPHPSVHVFTTISGGNGTGEIVAAPANIGAAPSTGPVTVEIGPLPPGIVFSGAASGRKWFCPGGAGQAVVVCTTNQTFEPIHAFPNPVSVPVEVVGEATLSSSVEVEISGGGSLREDVYQAPVVVSNEPAAFGVTAAFGGSTEADGSQSTQAGGHPFESSAYVFLNTRRLPSAGFEPLLPAAVSREVIVDLPPGFVGNPLAVRRCPQSELTPSAFGEPSLFCGAESAIGNLDPLVSSLKESEKTTARLYNDMPPWGAAAEFSTTAAGIRQSVIPGVNVEDDFGIRLAIPNNPNIAKIFGIFVAFEGAPTDGGGQALLTNAADCAESARESPLLSTLARSYQEPDNFQLAALPQPALTGCDKLKFEAVDPVTGEGQVTLSLAQSSADGTGVHSGSTPVGAVADLHVDQGGLTDPNGLATPPLKKASIELPGGLVLDPSAADGLEGCSEAQVGYRGNDFPLPNPIRFDGSQPACPDGSKLGTVAVETPLLEAPLTGEVFLADQGENPFGSLLAVYLVVDDPVSGVVIKLPGEVRVDPSSGRLTAIFDYNPQLPLEDLTIRLRGGGPRSLFATSDVCGASSTEAELTPWSAPESGPPAQTSDRFAVTGGCAASPAARPFSPSVEAGTTLPAAGAFAPLVVRVSRRDGEGEIGAVDFTLPRGLIGKLAGIPHCSNAGISAAERRSGRAERSAASCPPGSRLGSADVAVGVGTSPFHVVGDTYLAGPYRGAAVSAVAIVPALAGPLDLGDVVVRAPLYVDRETGELTAKSDPIPTALRGISLKVRSIAIDVDRPDFIRNPTNCEAMPLTTAIASSDGASVSSANRFQVEGCRGLRFRPRMKIDLSGATGRGGHPGVRATLSDSAGEATPASAAFFLPRGELLDLRRLRRLCPRERPIDQCPPGSRLGSVRARSPFLPEPLTGDVYLREPDRGLPDLIAEVHSAAVDFVIRGRAIGSRGRVGVRLESLPDVPLSSVVLSLAGGRRGIVVNSRSVCARKQRVSASLVGHNGARRHLRPPVRTPGCR